MVRFLYFLLRTYSTSYDPLFVKDSRQLEKILKPKEIRKISCQKVLSTSYSIVQAEIQKIIEWMYLTVRRYWYLITKTTITKVVFDFPHLCNVWPASPHIIHMSCPSLYTEQQTF